MERKRIQQKRELTPEQLAEIQAAREKFQRERPTMEQLVASGDAAHEPIPQGVYLELRALLTALRKEREKAGLSLADLSERTGMDRAALSRLETGQVPNPTVDTVLRYATGLGKRVG